MELVSVGMIQGTDGNVIVLREADGERMLALGIGLMEASSIAMEVEDIQPPRPMTHDLLQNVITRMQGAVQRVVVHDLRNDTFIGQVDIYTEKGVMEIDSRPSDAIALALRCDAPIYASDNVLELAGIHEDVLDNAETEES
jgi:hypothetical protein